MQAASQRPPTRVGKAGSDQLRGHGSTKGGGDAMSLSEVRREVKCGARAARWLDARHGLHLSLFARAHIWCRYACWLHAATKAMYDASKFQVVV